MARTGDIDRALRLTLVWLLVLVALPFGGGPAPSSSLAEACESWCPCEGSQELADHDDCDDPDCSDDDCDHDDCSDDEDCDDACGEDCAGCCTARTLVALGFEPLRLALPGVMPTRGPPALDAPGQSLPTGVFRPPRSLT